MIHARKVLFEVTACCFHSAQCTGKHADVLPLLCLQQIASVASAVYKQTKVFAAISVVELEGERNFAWEVAAEMLVQQAKRRTARESGILSS